MMNERLVLLATAQESMTEVDDKMAKLDISQLTIEKSAFDAMNVSDHILNMSRECKGLVAKMQEYLQRCTVCPEEEAKLNIASLLEELQNKLQKIGTASSDINDISHKIEGETASQRVIKEGINHSLTHVRESVDVAVACAEFTFCECEH